MIIKNPNNVFKQEKDQETVFSFIDYADLTIFSKWKQNNPNMEILNMEVKPKIADNFSNCSVMPDQTNLINLVIIEARKRS